MSLRDVSVYMYVCNDYIWRMVSVRQVTLTCIDAVSSTLSSMANRTVLLVQLPENKLGLA